MFQYKTNGDVSPQGKRRVYFTCHHEDHERFFEKIKDEILKYSDCAIWYNNNDYEDINSDLGQMNLFVIPITTRLLTKPCRAMQLDVPFALENHIPILPLMQEEGLDELFSRYFGDLQYLDPNSHDITAISYEEKLKKYLNSVIIGDELAEKVRAAFDAYIFLSYRKKDRKYANELMRLIHKNEFCRDIAIWYDEFLVPGEDFNNAIAAALKKSELFALVVTPNIINEKNYVQTVEYPEATKQHKKVLPVELVKTDHKELSKQYPEIPNCVDIQDEIALSKSFEYALLNITKKENDLDPEHNFFIGLAYLDGIDVEKNHERALSLITSAAETNKVPEAIEKLVAMYKEGYGVKRDYRKAVEWQKRLVEYWEYKYTMCPNTDIYRKLISNLYTYAIQLFSLKEISKSKVIYKKIIELFNKKKDSIDYNIMLNVYKDYGICCLYDYNLEDIEIPLQQGLSLIDQIKTKNVEINLIYWQYEFYELLGKFYDKKEDLSKAELCFLKAASLIVQLERDIDNSRMLNLFTIIGMFYDKKNIIYENKNDCSNAEYFYNLAISLITHQHHEKYISKGFLEAMGTTYKSFGVHLLFNSNKKGAKEFFQKSLDVSKILNKEYESYNSLQELANSYLFIGNIYKQIGNLEKAESFYQKALSYFYKLMDAAWSKDVQESIIMCYTFLGDYYKKNNDLYRSEELLRNATILEEQLLEKTGDLHYLLTLAANFEKLGEIKNCNGDKKKAEMYYRKVIISYEQLKNESEIDVRKKLSINYIKIAVILYEIENLDEAEIFFKRAIYLGEQLIKDSEDDDISFRLALSYMITGTIRLPYKRDLLEKALQISTTIAEKNPQCKEYSKIRDNIIKLLEQAK